MPRHEYEKRKSGQISVMSVIYVISIIAIVLVLLAGPYFEMQTFNKFTKGKKATYLDAMFSELRVTPDK